MKNCLFTYHLLLLEIILEPFNYTTTSTVPVALGEYKYLMARMKHFNDTKNLAPSSMYILLFCEQRTNQRCCCAQQDMWYTLASCRFNRVAIVARDFDYIAKTLNFEDTSWCCHNSTQTLPHIEYYRMLVLETWHVRLSTMFALKARPSKGSLWMMIGDYG